MRSARLRDAKPLVRLLERVASEPQPTLLLVPGESSVRDWRRRIAGATADQHSLYLVAVVAGELIGNIALDRDRHPNSGHVAWVGISIEARFRGMGVGGMLLETAAAWAAGGGVSKLALGVFPENERALAFYEQHGFSREGLRRAQYTREGRYHDEVLMARLLPASP